MGKRKLKISLYRIRKTSAALLLMNSANFGSTSADVIKSVSICVAAFVMVFFIKWHPILVICLAGIAGYIMF